MMRAVSEGYGQTSPSSPRMIEVKEPQYILMLPGPVHFEIAGHAEWRAYINKYLRDLLAISKGRKSQVPGAHTELSSV
jgi:hypothetical protein